MLDAMAAGDSAEDDKAVKNDKPHNTKVLAVCILIRQHCEPTAAGWQQYKIKVDELKLKVRQLKAGLLKQQSSQQLHD